MRRSTSRIIVSHAGTLPRPAELQELFAGGEATREAFEKAVPDAIKDVVRRQAEAGVDVVNDGEFDKRGIFIGYIRDRMSGFERRPELASRPRDAGVTGRDRRDFPGFHAAGGGGFNVGAGQGTPPGTAARGTGAGTSSALAAVPGGFPAADAGPFMVTGPLTYTGYDAVATDIKRLKAACEGLDVEPYLPAIAPGTIEHWLWRGEHFKSDEEFLFAIADVMHEEYKAITDAGVVLQIDDPDLPDGWQMYPDMTVSEYRRYAELRVDAINHALRGIPEELVRLHVCWGSMHGPHRDDIALADLVDLILKVRAECYSIEAANPRHEHEWNVFEDVKLPEGKSLMPGVVGHTSNTIEHPELVAQRLIRYANLVGRENVIAGTDCGLGNRVHAEIVWAKLEDMAKGAELATKELWRR